MNVRLKYFLDFTAGVFFRGQLHMTNYRAKMYMVTVSAETEDHNIAFERIKHYVTTVIDSSVLINAEDEDRCRALAQSGLRVITLPEEPVDQVVGMMLFTKLNAIMEKRMLLLEIELASEIGGNLIYLHADDENLGPLEAAGWWHQSDLSHCHDQFLNDENRMHLNRYAAWRELELNWPVNEELPAGNTIVFADFGKDAKK
jgi:hypothetical protein